jgi:hypothetical protein
MEPAVLSFQKLGLFSYSQTFKKLELAVINNIEYPPNTDLNLFWVGMSLQAYPTNMALKKKPFIYM